MDELPPSWPREPYKGLAYYGPDDVPLFVGRDDDVSKCVRYLTDASTRILILHGQSGCGKSSFLRAGLIPRLERLGFGYLFLRSDDPNGTSEKPLFIRCGPDPVSRLAEAIYEFISKPRNVATAEGLVSIDASSALVGYDSNAAFVRACIEPSILLKVIGKALKKFPYTFVMVLDQVEEVITLETPHSTGKKRFVEFLHQFIVSSIDFKLVLALRKEYFGEIFGLIQFDASLMSDIKQFLLGDLTETQVRDAILLPTLTSKTRTDLPPPFETYGFAYAPDLPDLIVGDLFRVMPSGGVLPVMQMVCRDLYNAVKLRPAPKIIDSMLYRSGGGVTGCVDRHITRSLQVAFDRAGLALGSRETEQRPWRLKLWSLAKRSPDGTAKSDLVSEAHFGTDSLQDGVDSRTSRILNELSDPDVLVLRKFSALMAGTGQHVTQYSLGHDAIALALCEWKIIDDQLTLQVAGQKARRNRWIVAAAAAVALFGVSVWYVIGKQRDVDSFVATALRVQRTDVVLAITAAMQAIRESRNTLFRKTEPMEALRSILAKMPSAPWRGGAAGFPMHQPHKLVFWDGQTGMKIVDPLKCKVDDETNLFSDDPIGAAARDSLGEKPFDTSLVALSAQQVAPEYSVALIWPTDPKLWSRGGKLYVLNDGHAELVPEAIWSPGKLDPASQAENPSAPVLTENIMYLTWQGNERQRYKAFVLDGAIAYANELKVGAEIGFARFNQYTGTSARYPLWVTSGTLLVGRGYDALLLGVPFDTLEAFDLHRTEEKPIWTLDNRDDPNYSACSAVSGKPPRCAMVPVWAIPRDLSFFALNVVKEPLAGFSDGLGIADAPIELMLVGAQNGNTRRIPWSELDGILANAGANPAFTGRDQGSSLIGQGRNIAFLDGEIGAAAMGISSATSVDLLSLSDGGQPNAPKSVATYVGTLLDVGDVTYWKYWMVLNQDLNTVVIGMAADGMVKEWRVPSRGGTMIPQQLASLDPDQLMIRACQYLSARKVTADAWFRETGIPKPPANLCAPQ
jgi:hypothetical protein